MPSHSVKQAKVMSAISHGWHPSSGSVAKIPVKVAKEFHAADAGHKYGKKHYAGGAIKSALNTVRKYSRKAEGGEVDDTPPDFNALKKVYISPHEGLAEDLTKKSPLEGREPAQEASTYNPPIGQKITNYLKGPDTPFYAPRANMVDMAAEAHELTPWMQAKRAGENVAKGNYQAAAMTFLPAAKKAEGFGQALLHAADTAMADSAVGDIVFKKLKAQYPKDIATASIDNDLTPEQIGNLKTYMTPGAQKAFEKHYAKMAPKQEPSFKPALWNTPEIQATKPGLKVVPTEGFGNTPPNPTYKMELPPQPKPGLKLTQKPESAFEDFKMPKESQPFGVPSDQFAIKGSMVPANHPAWNDFNKWHDLIAQQPINLTSDQKAAVGYWGSQAGYKDINESLRGHSVGSGMADHAIENLDSAMKVNPLKENASVWRGLYGPQAEQLRKLKQGDTFFNKGYTATTVDPRQSTHYGAKDTLKYGKKDEDANILLNYHLPAGHPSLYVSHPEAGNYIQSERELLLPHGGQYQIIGTEKIKSPVWHYLGHLTDPTPHEFTVYHVAPAPQGSKATQLDVGKSMPEPWQEKATQALKEAEAKVDQFKQEPYTPHNENEFNPGNDVNMFGEEEGAFKPTGKDSDIEDFYKHQEEHQAGPEWEPPPGWASPDFTQAIDDHVKLINYKDYKPPKADPVPDSLKKYRDKIIEAGGNPDTILLKGGHHSDYPLKTPTKHDSYSSKTKGLFLADQKASANMYGTAITPYVAVPRNPVAEIDFHALLKATGDLNYSGHASALKEEFVATIKHIRETYNPEMLIAHNVHDVADTGSKAATQYIVFNTNILRAPHAGFDPAKWHLRLPLAGIAGLSAGAGIYSYGDEAQAAEHKAGGGKVTKKEKDPEDHEFIDFKRGGLIDSDIPGRTDKIPMKVSPGSYVLPADIPSALGQGNTKAGSDVLSKMFTSGPYGLKPMMTQRTQPFRFRQSHKFADGGGADHVPIVAAGGEFIIHPDVVKILGEGNMAEGHRLLDKFVLHTRAQHIKTLRKLKPPKP